MLRRCLFAAVIVSLRAGVGSPAYAQAIVFDPSNYSQNILTAARALEQINNQLRSLENQARLLCLPRRSPQTRNMPRLLPPGARHERAKGTHPASFGPASRPRSVHRLKNAGSTHAISRERVFHACDRALQTDEKRSQFVGTRFFETEIIRRDDLGHKNVDRD